jgi:hypothetical protein
MEDAEMIVGTSLIDAQLALVVAVQAAGSPDDSDSRQTMVRNGEFLHEIFVQNIAKYLSLPRHERSY